MNHKPSEKITVEIEARDMRRLIHRLVQGAGCDISLKKPKPRTHLELMERAVADTKEKPSIEDPGAVQDNLSSLRIWKALTAALDRNSGRNRKAA